MASKVIAFSAIVASASAFAPTSNLPTSSLRLRSTSNSVTGMSMKNGRAPVVTVFDHRGCSRAPKEYQGDKAEGQDDEMMIKVSFQKIQIAEEAATRVLQESLTALSQASQTKRK